MSTAEACLEADWPARAEPGTGVWFDQSQQDSLDVLRG